jgi:hypothetical protein
MVHTMLLAGNYIPVPSLRLSSIPNISQPGLQCDVVFGAPSADCRGTGICKITGTHGLSSLNHKKECRITQGFLVENPASEGISFIFFRSSLCTQLYKNHFRKGVLQMNEPCQIPDEISSQLQTPFTQINAGTYQVTEMEGYFVVQLQCQV